MAKTNYVTTPRMIVSGFTAVTKPTQNFDKTAEEFQLKAAISAEDAAAFVAQMEAIRDEEAEKIRKDKPKFAKVLEVLPVGTPELDEETGEETGRLVFNFKQAAEITIKSGNRAGEIIKKTVAVMDSRGKPIKGDVRVGPGSIVKVSFEPNPYFNAKDKVVGMSFNRMAGVQIITLVEYTGGMSAEALGFGDEGEEDGFSADDYVGGSDQTSGNAGDDEAEVDF